jgi:DNA-binding transcriptional MocR family regulator
VVVIRPGAGTFVAQPRDSGHVGPAGYSWQTVALAERSVDVAGLSSLADPPDADGVISLATGYLHPSLMPLVALRAALARASRTPDARDVLITGGGQDALSAAFRALLPPAAPLLVESPTYPGALAVARAAGIRPGARG